MAVVVPSIDSLQKYLQGVMGRADHHAREIEDIILAIVGAVVWKKSGEISVRTRKGEMANEVQVAIGGKKYAICYSHELKRIEVRNNNNRGLAIAHFDNDTPVREVKEFFATL